MMVFKHNLSTYSLQKQYPHPKDVFQKVYEIPAEKSSRFDVQIAHGRFNKRKLMNKMQTDAVYVATLRHPFMQFRSHYFYDNQRPPFSVVQRDFESMIKNSIFDPLMNKLRLRQSLYLENSMFKYFEFDTNRALLNQTYYQECLHSLASLFRMIITEYYDESLLLLKEELCWDIKDIVYLSHKNASFPGKNKTPEEYGILYERHRNISRLDYMLYDFFLHILKQKVKKAGREFQKRLFSYKQIKARVSTFCLEMRHKLMYESNYITLQRMLSKTIAVDGFDSFDSFSISGYDCVMMSLCEFNYKDARLALNYPTLCTRSMYAVKPPALFCPSTKDGVITFQHYNLTFPLQNLKRLLSCDMAVAYN